MQRKNHTRTDTLLFTAKKRGEQTYQAWVTPGEAARKRPAWESDGWTVTVLDPRAEAQA